MNIVKLLNGLLSLFNFIVRRQKVEQHETNVEEIKSDPVASFGDKFGGVRKHSATTNNDLHSSKTDPRLSRDNERD